MKSFNVINYNFNSGKFVGYDIMPYLIRAYEKKKEKKETLPETFDEFKNFVKSESQYQFWSRCEYEFLVAKWPFAARQTFTKVLDKEEIGYLWKKVGDNKLGFAVRASSEQCFYTAYGSAVRATAHFITVLVKQSGYHCIVLLCIRDIFFPERRETDAATVTTPSPPICIRTRIIICPARDQ